MGPEERWPASHAIAALADEEETDDDDESYREEEEEEEEEEEDYNHESRNPCPVLYGKPSAEPALHQRP